MWEVWLNDDGLGDQECERLTPNDIAFYVAGAGFPSNSVPVAVAIAMAESSGNTCAHNPIPPDDSYGLFQVNMLGKLGPQRRAQFGLRSNTELFDPATNADAAYSISNGGRNFRPWSTYTSGAYRRFLNSISVPADTSGGETSGGETPPILLPPLDQGQIDIAPSGGGGIMPAGISSLPPWAIPAAVVFAILILVGR